VTAVAGLAALIALAACGASQVPAPSNATSIASQAKAWAPETTVAPQPADREMFEFNAFRSPSGNVGCMVDTDYVRCDIGEPAQFVCGAATAQAPAADPLPYGESIIAEQMICEGAESGITCRDTASGVRFTISREA
jgi:hypothetical protein